MALNYLYDDALQALSMSSSTYSIGVGEGVLLGTGAQNVSAATWNDEANARKVAAATFAGIAEKGSPADSDSDVVVRQEGVFRLTCTSCTPTYGTLFGWEKDSGGNYLDTDKLQVVTDPAEAQFECVRDYGSATTTVDVRLLRRTRSVQTVWLPVVSLGSDHRSSGVAISNWQFGQPVDVIEAYAMLQNGALSSEFGIVLNKNGSFCMTSMSFVADDADGEIHSLAVSLDSSAWYSFAADDKLHVHLEGPVGAGANKVAVGFRVVAHGGKV